MRLLLLLSALCFATAAAAQDSVVRDTSHQEADGRRVLQHAADIPAPQDAVWRAWTTEAGWKAWSTPVVKIDLSVGGMIESNYDPAAKIGDPGNIKNQILAYIPDRLLIIRNVQAPPGFPAAKEFQQTATVIELAPLTPTTTRVTITGVGFQPGPSFDQAYSFFARGNAATLEQLHNHFTKR